MSQTQRVLEILNDLSQMKEICTKELSIRFGIDIRATQRDMKIIRSFLCDSLYKTTNGCYKIINNSEVLNFFKDQQKLKTTKDIKNFFEFLTLFDENVLKFFDHEEFGFINQIKKDTDEIYHIHENPIEKLQSSNMIEDLKKAIKNRYYIDLDYQEDSKKDFFDVKPHKIVYAKGNWYLSAITKNYQLNSGFKFFRINFIKKIEMKKNKFQRDIEIEMFIKNFQSLFEDYQTPKYEVKIEVNREVARHFRVKKHLKSQKIIDEIDGNLIISYQINRDMEIIPLIKTWLPHLKVISPISLDNKIKEDIKKYLNDI